MDKNSPMTSVPTVVPTKGKYTFYLIDVDNGVVVAIWEQDEPVHSVESVKKAANLAATTGRRYSIARNTIFIRPPKRS